MGVLSLWICGLVFLAPQVAGAIERDLAAVPVVSYSSDDGMGAGAVGTLYSRAEGVEPYRSALTLRLYITDKLVQWHDIILDAVEPFGLPVRVYSRLGYYSTRTQNFCGFGNGVTCDPRVAREQFRATGHDPRHYYTMRFIRAYADAIVRVPLWGRSLRPELFVGWRVSHNTPGQVGESGPYPGSLYAEYFPDGEPGWVSTPMAGLFLDGRDQEAFPTAGFVTEASIRGAAGPTGSDWSYLGLNASFAHFRSLLPKYGRKKLVLATRGLIDGLVGEPPTEQIARVGGTVDAIAFGGQAMGRGIREQRYVGKLKTVLQVELRSLFSSFVLWGQHIEIGGAIFSDVGFVGADEHDVESMAAVPLVTAGASCRYVWNRDFVVRFDLGLSPSEERAPGVYVMAGNVF